MNKKILIISMLLSPVVFADDNPFKFKEIKPNIIMQEKENKNIDPRLGNFMPDNLIQSKIDEKSVLQLDASYFFISNINGTRIFHNIETDEYLKVSEEEYQKKLNEFKGVK